MPPDRSDTDEPLEDREPAPPFPLSCDDIVPLISFDFTISCFASLLFVPGFVRLIFIFSPLSTVAECSTAILPGLPGFPCAALTLLPNTTAALLCFPTVLATIAEEPFAFPVLLLPTLFTMLPFPFAGLFDRPVEFNTQAELTDDNVDGDTVDVDEHEDVDEDDDDDDDDDEDDDDDDDDNDEDNDDEEETEEFEEEEEDDDGDEFDD